MSPGGGGAGIPQEAWQEGAAVSCSQSPGCTITNKTDYYCNSSSASSIEGFLVRPIVVRMQWLGFCFCLSFEVPLNVQPDDLQTPQWENLSVAKGPFILLSIFLPPLSHSSLLRPQRTLVKTRGKNMFPASFFTSCCCHKVEDKQRRLTASAKDDCAGEKKEKKKKKCFGCWLTGIKNKTEPLATRTGYVWRSGASLITEHILMSKRHQNVLQQLHKMTTATLCDVTLFNAHT